MSYIEETEKIKADIIRMEQKLEIEREVLRRVENIVYAEEKKSERFNPKYVNPVKKFSRTNSLLTLKDRVLQCMKDHPEKRFSVRDLHKCVESVCPGRYKKNSIYATLSNLLEYGQVIKLSEGLYKIEITEKVNQEQKNGALIPTVLKRF